MEGHEDFRARLLQHLIQHYDKHQDFDACQAANAMINEYTNQNHKSLINGYAILNETMKSWTKVKEPKEDYEITGCLYSHCVPIEEIFRVKRLSDGETFKVGDTILEGKIKAIRILDNGTCYLKDEDWFVELKDAQKYIAPPFEFWRTREEQIKGYPIVDDSSINEELTPTCEGFWKQFEILTNDPNFIAERNVLLGYEFTEECMLDFGKFCQLFNKDVNIEDIFRVWKDDRGDT